ncbi:MAG TPA: AVAST type 2 anti-phage system protein Avs2 [Oculatellaceae cyanobacterium]
MSSEEWLKLRAWNNSKQEAFEELCTQIFMHKQMPDGCTFTRVGAPDAGVEAMWEYPNGKIAAMQAKFFTASFSSTQWKELDESVRTALTKRPALASYTVMTPFNLPDPNVADKKSMMDRWKEHVKTWKDFAITKNMNVAFEYFGGSQILAELSKELHAGRLYFWFEKQFFSDAWFHKRLQETITLADERYTPLVHVPVSLDQLFAFVGREQEVFDRFHNLNMAVLSAWNDLQKGASSTDALEQVRPAIVQIELQEETLDFKQQRMVDFESLAESSGNALSLLREYIRVTQAQRKSEDSQPSTGGSAYRDFHAERLLESLSQLQRFASRRRTALLKHPIMLLTGPAGNGKTHLFCRIADARIGRGLPTILLLGEQFNDEEPFSQIQKLLGLPPKTQEEFLGALQASAEARGNRALIMIDALNETRVDNLWGSHLPRMITAIQRFSMIGLCVSIRSTYLEDIVPTNSTWSKSMTRFDHDGFAGVEEQATRHYFTHYKIEPSHEPLTPEFRNPQFLKLFCKGLHNKGLTRAPDGHEGICSVYNLFIDSVNDKLSRKRYLNFRRSDQLVQQSISLVAAEMAKTGEFWIERKQAQSMLDELLPDREFGRTLYDGLVSEGILSEERIATRGRNTAGVMFSYQKFSEHLLAKTLSDKAASDFKAAFRGNGILHKYVDAHLWRWRGVLEAMCIVLPDEHHVELFEVLPRDVLASPSFIEAFLHSLVWRRSENIQDSAIDFINRRIIGTHFQNLFFEIAIQIAGKKKNALNADGLHDYLIKLSLSSRDYIWTRFLHSALSDDTPVNRLIYWASAQTNLSNFDDETISLYGTVLVWFFTSSNRFIRDKATKALVELLASKPYLWLGLLDKFKECNDPYVIERLYAVGAGVALRCADLDVLKKLGQTVFDTQFRNGAPVAHVLIRKYAAAIVNVSIEFAGLQIPPDKPVHPPFKTLFDESTLPNKTIKKKYLSDSARNGYHHIWFSLTQSDFAQYVIMNRMPWTSKRLNGTAMIDSDAIYERFFAELTARQTRAWSDYQQARNADPKPTLQEFLEDKPIEYPSEKKLQRFKRLLGKRKTSIFERWVFFRELGRQERHPFDTRWAQRWLFTRVVDLGWNAKLFDDFDRNVSSHSSYREARKPERIGKKYQWIAYHELLAHLNDHFQFKPNEYEPYTSPPDVQDIDPSCLIEASLATNSQTRSWWSPIDYDGEPNLTLNEWVQDCTNLPDLTRLILVRNPNDLEEWLNMNGSHNWVSESRTSVAQPRAEKQKRDLIYLTTAYIVRAPEAQKFHRWALKQDFFGRWMPETPDFNDVYIGEYPWADSFRQINIPYFHRRGWSDETRKEKLPVPAIVAADEYRSEREYDCSTDSKVSFHVPCKWLIDSLKLKWDRKVGFNSNAKLVAFDPSVNSKGSSCLLVNKSALSEFCKTSGFAVVWIVYGEKLAWPSSSQLLDNRLHISGSYLFDGDTIKGRLNPKVIAWSQMARVPHE